MPLPPRPADPCLATQTLELSLAAPQVVAHRLARMAAAGPMPSARDREEFSRMGDEKVLAFQQSWAAMWLQACLTPLQLPKVLAAGLGPVHAQAVANAKRLGRSRSPR